MAKSQRVSGKTGTGEWTRVIVLAAPAVHASAEGQSTPRTTHQDPARVPAVMDAEFRRRDWFAVVQHDPYLALAELALRERAQAARSAWGLQRMEGLALVVLEPSHWPDHTIRLLCAAIRRWLPPSVSLWQVEGDHLTPLDEADADADFTPKPVHASRARHQVEPAHELQHATGVDEPHVNADAPSQAHRLTRDEIDMLLREDASEHNEADVRETPT